MTDTDTITIIYAVGLALVGLSLAAGIRLALHIIERLSRQAERATDRARAAENLVSRLERAAAGAVGGGYRSGGPVTDLGVAHTADALTQETAAMPRVAKRPGRGRVDGNE